MFFSDWIPNSVQHFIGKVCLKHSRLCDNSDKSLVDVLVDSLNFYTMFVCVCDCVTGRGIAATAAALVILVATTAS